jgi:hypothetical protein
MTHARTKPPTQQRSYGVLVGTIRDGPEDSAGHSSGPAKTIGSR